MCQNRLPLRAPLWVLQGYHKDLGFKGPCTQIVYTFGPMSLHREYFKANVYTVWVHGPLG